jgi:hypothetical protein
LNQGKLTVRLDGWLFLTALSLVPLFAQTPRAIVADGSSPWRDDQWVFTAAELGFYFGDQTGNTWLDAVILQGPSP